MTHVSKQQLTVDHLNQLFVQLNVVIGRLDKSNSTIFLDEFLGVEEKIMLAKRLATIVMCFEKNSSYRISQLLYMSPSTTERIKLNYEMGKYDGIEKILTNNKKEYKQFWRILELVLQAGMPPRGRGRWKSILN